MDSLVPELSTESYYYIEKYFSYLLAAALIIGVIGLGIAVAEAMPPDDEVETETVASMTVDTGYEHSATTVRPSLVFDEGETLDDRVLYFTRIAPVLNGGYTLSYSGDEPGELEVELAIFLQHVEDVGGEEVVHWQERDVVATESRTLEDGDNEHVSFDVEVQRLQNRTQLIIDDLDAEPGETKITVVADATVQSQQEGEVLTDSRTDLLEIGPDGAIYRVENDLAGSERHQVTEERQVPGERSILRLLLGVVLLLGATVAGGLLYQLRDDRPLVSERDKERIVHDKHREEFDDWISKGSVPDDDMRLRVEMDSLKALVDVAIDANTRVIDRGAGQTPQYVVLTADTRYTYDPEIGVY